jgi:hypothetical protein
MPQDHTVPSDRSASAYCPPAATWITPVSRGTRTGEDVDVVLPLPSWAPLLSPHAHKLPSDSTA